jgi:hypothetical protein
MSFQSLARGPSTVPSFITVHRDAARVVPTKYILPPSPNICCLIRLKSQNDKYLRLEGVHIIEEAKLACT